MEQHRAPPSTPPCGCRPLRLVGPGSRAADVASLDFFARDQCGRSLLTEVAKNSNAPRAPAGPSASLGTLGMELGLAAGEGSVDGHQKGLG